MARIITILILNLCLTKLSIGQDNFSIKKFSMPNGGLSEYLYKHKKIIIKRLGKTVESIKLSNSQKNKLDSTLKSIHISNLRNEYIGGGIDGKSFTFSFKTKGLKKEIYLHNYYNDTLDLLLRYINTLIPEGKQFISFGKDMHLKPDTLIKYIPDFYLKEVELPETIYESFLIIPFGKDYPYTSPDSDSIELFECRIYPKDYNKNAQRIYWKAFRQNNNQWRREYYSNDTSVVKTDFIYDIIPYQIIDEKVVVDHSKKPTVTITRYYKTRNDER